MPRLADAAGDCLGTLKGEGNIAAGNVAIYPDGRTLVTGDPCGKIHRWNLAGSPTGRPYADKHDSQIQDLAVAPNGRLLATASCDYTLRIWSIASEQTLARCHGHSKEVLRVSWAPDSLRLASASADSSVRIWDALSGAGLLRCYGHQDQVYGLHWSPDGRRLASGSRDQTIRIWDADDGATLRQLQLCETSIESVRWSPDGRWLATAGEDTTIRLWDTETWRIARQWDAHGDAHFLSCLAWSPDGRLLASGAHGDRTIVIWEAATGRPLARFEAAESYTWRLAWAPDGAFLASKHGGAVCRLWDTRPLLDSTAAGASTVAVIPAELAGLPAALTRLHRLGLYPPLSLVRELLALTGGPAAGRPFAGLAEHPGVRACRELRWPPAARLGLVALLLRDLPLTAWQPPAGITPGELSAGLEAALAGVDRPLQPSLPPLAALRQAANGINERLLTLLSLLGPAAVAADPGLPLRLQHRLPELPRLTAPQRRLLGLKLRLEAADGRAETVGRGGERAGLGLTGGLRDLLPSQLALPGPVFHGRYQRRELLYRTHTGREPRRLRPLVLVLDVSPPCFGPVETALRLAAHAIAVSLQRAATPVMLIAAGGDNRVCELAAPSDWVELWTLRSLAPVAAAPTLRLAGLLRESLRGGPLEPAIVLLTHPWFGADEDLPDVPGLRARFVTAAGQPRQPALAERCECWRMLSAAALTRQIAELGWLVA